MPRRFFKKSIFSVLLLLLAVSLVNAGSSSKYFHQSNPWLDNTGGPDLYGYTWIDSNEPGGPPFNWIDISIIGESVTGLGDDNSVGPFAVGFDFNYYWYTIDQFYIGSNGYLKMPPQANIASPFPASIPLTALPNDYIAIYGGDLDFSQGQGHCYYYSNDDDTCIVSWVDVPAWSTGGSHTFQVFLNGNDNTIHFNYGTQRGTFSTVDIIIGIENNNGQVGLQHSADVLAPQDYTVVYHRPDTTTYQVHDYAAFRVLNENSTAEFVEVGDSFLPIAWVKNVGNQNETGGTVRCVIQDTASTVFYDQTVNLTPIAPGMEAQIAFPSDFIPPVLGQYKVTVNVTLAGDMNPNNNTMIAEIDAIEIPGELSHDIGSTTWGSNWNGDDGGFAQYFEPLEYPAPITNVRFYMSTVNSPPQINYVKIFDDDGPNGAPGTLLFSQEVSITTGSIWYTVDVTDVEIDDGGFYAAWQQTASSVTYLGIDSIPPASRCCWELTGTWSPYRDAETEDAMIRVMIGEGSIPEPMIDSNLDTLDFGTVLVGDTATMDLIIYNTGSAGDLILSTITLLGAPPNLIFDWTGFTPGMVVESGDSAVIVVRFHPVLAMTWNGQLTINNNSTNNTQYPVSVTGTGQINSVGNGGSIANTYGLEECYPNPFNAQTTISFNLAKDGYTTLKVYNVRGDLVSELVAGRISAGNHSVVLDASQMTSGVYFYQLESGEFSQVKKMVLMK